MKIIIKTPKPRNPLALAARARRAGAHEDSHNFRSMRRKEKQNLGQLRRQLKENDDA